MKPAYVDLPLATYQDYYVKQVGGGLPYFAGPRQRGGFGLGSVLGAAVKSFVIPMLGRVLARAPKALLGLGKNVARDALRGKNVKQSVQRHGIRTLKKQGGAAINTLLHSRLPVKRKKGKKRRQTPTGRPRRRLGTLHRGRRPDIFG